ncbi:MAG: Bax inhibitor-1/YccA family protein [Propionicimonas sp.]|nr:Bax inhibitor-1/YccA family protein [Propionicimonas sp.]
MQSSNPVLSKAEWGQPVQAQYASGQPLPGQPVPGQQFPGQYPPGYDPYAQQYGQPPVQPAPTGVMTIDDVLTKSAITIGTVILSAALTMYGFYTGVIPATLLQPAMIVGALVSFGVVLLVSFRRKINPAFVLAYAAIEGVFLGAISVVFELLYPGIVIPAVLGTFVAAGATLAAYKFFRIKVTNKFRRMIVIGTMAYAGVLLVNFVLSLFGVNLGIISVAGEVSWIALLASAVGVGLAVFNLILDFDYIEQGIAARAPASESWRGAFGLTVTLVWLYVEILRILSYFRR